MSDKEVKGALFDNGDTFKVDGHEFEVASVAHSDDADGNPTNISYNVRLKADIDAERQAESDHQAELEAAAKEADNV